MKAMRHLKRSILAAVLCAAIVLAFAPGKASAADNRLSFISINDTLPPDLINVAVVYGGITYVPYWLFTNYRLGLTYSFFSGNSTAYLTNSDRQLFFEMNTGKTYDGDDYYYSAVAIMWGGTVYLPLSFVCSFFGTFAYASIGGNDYGSILRITTGSEVLTDAEFLRAAGPAMKRYYDAYNKPTTTDAPAESPMLTPTLPPPTPAEEKLPHEGQHIRIGFDGMPSKNVLELLQRVNMHACFFVTADEIRSDPDLVRETACKGHTLGVACVQEGAEIYTEAVSTLWECARIRAVLSTVSESALVPAEAVAFPSVRETENLGEPVEIVQSITSQLENTSGDQVVLFPASGDITAQRLLLYTLRDQGYSVTAIRETDGIAVPIKP